MMGSVIILNKKCKSCYICLNACPKKLLVKGTTTNREGNFQVEFKDEKNECTGCAICAKRCPDMALEVYR